MKSKNIILFASGRGSNVQSIIDYFRNNITVCTKLIVTNNPNAGVIQIAKKENIPYKILAPENLSDNAILQYLQQLNPELIVLAGFLKKIPKEMIALFPDKIINIHPALLPKHGGKGMYGTRVHQSVLSAKDQISGITIHYVNSSYDKGTAILQATCTVNETDDDQTLAKRVLQLEHFYLPRCIEFLLRDN